MVVTAVSAVAREVSRVLMRLLRAWFSDSLEESECRRLDISSSRDSMVLILVASCADRSSVLACAVLVD